MYLENYSLDEFCLVVDGEPTSAPVNGLSADLEWDSHMGAWFIDRLYAGKVRIDDDAHCKAIVASAAHYVAGLAIQEDICKRAGIPARESEVA